MPESISGAAFTAAVALALAEGIRQCLELVSMSAEWGAIRVAASFGVAGLSPECGAASHLLHLAYNAMCLAKKVGGNRVQLHDRNG